jgi:nitrogen-specific signal transduction histidine kinase/ActR/RegA family two-component response regulator
MDNKGKEKSILIIDRDITEKVRLEEQFFRAQRMETIGALASGIAHDLNNILSPIMLTAQLLRMQTSIERGSTLLDSLETNAQRGANLVKQILSFARGMSNERLVIQLRHIINDIKKISRETFPKSIDINTDVPKDLWLVYGDPTQLDQVFMNLCVNARDAMPDGGLLKITAENQKLEKDKISNCAELKGNEFVLFTISDTGTGIPKDIVDKIFEPFFTTKEVGKGTGLGLSTVNTIIKEHGGRIDVQSEVGKGTQFRIFLPAIQSTALLDVGDQQPELLTGNNEYILVVDDEISIIEISKTILETYGYKVMTAYDGSEALKIFNENQETIKLVLIDMLMPVMDGPMCIRALRKISPKVKIIGSTGHAESEQFMNFIEPQVQSFLAKPYTPANLLKTINKVLKET